MTRLALVAGVALALTASSARADDFYPTDAQGPLPATLAPEVAVAVAQAEFIWKATPGCPVEVYAYDDPDPAVLGRGEEPGCRVWLARWYLASIAKLDRPGRMLALCTIVTHEVGHNLGYDHSDPIHNGVMTTGQAPLECIAASNTLPGVGKWHKRAKSRRKAYASKHA